MHVRVAPLMAQHGMHASILRQHTEAGDCDRRLALHGLHTQALRACRGITDTPAYRVRLVVPCPGSGAAGSDPLVRFLLTFARHAFSSPWSTTRALAAIGSVKNFGE